MIDQFKCIIVIDKKRLRKNSLIVLFQTICNYGFLCCIWYNCFKNIYNHTCLYRNIIINQMNGTGLKQPVLYYLRWYWTCVKQRSQTVFFVEFFINFFMSYGIYAPEQFYNLVRLRNLFCSKKLYSGSKILISDTTLTRLTIGSKTFKLFNFFTSLCLPF